MHIQASLPEEGQGFARLEEAMSACDVAKRCLGQLQDHATGKESLTEPELLKILDVLYSLKDPGSLSFMSDIPAVLGDALGAQALKTAGLRRLEAEVHLTETLLSSCNVTLERSLATVHRLPETSSLPENADKLVRAACASCSAACIVMQRHVTELEATPAAFKRTEAFSARTMQQLQGICMMAPACLRCLLVLHLRPQISAEPYFHRLFEHVMLPASAGYPHAPLLSTLLALLDAIAKAVVGEGLHQQLQLVKEASCSLLSQLLDDGTTALHLPYSAGSEADSRPRMSLLPTDIRKHGLPDVHLAHALGKQFHPNMLEGTVQLLRWLRTGPCSSLAAPCSSQERLEWLSGTLLVAGMQCSNTRQPHSMLTPPASQDGEVQEDGFFGSLFQEAEPGSSGPSISAEPDRQQAWEAVFLSSLCEASDVLQQVFQEVPIAEVKDSPCLNAIIFILDQGLSSSSSSSSVGRQMTALRQKLFAGDGFVYTVKALLAPASDAKTAQMLGKATMMRRMACSQLLQEMHLGFGAPCAFDLWVLYALSSQACARGRLEPTFQDWLISDDRLVTIWTSSLALSSSQTATVLSILFSCLVSAAESHTPLSAEAPVEMRPEGLQMLLIGLMVLLAGAETGLPTWLTILLQPALQVPDSTSNPRNPDQASKPSIRALRLASAWVPLTSCPAGWSRLADQLTSGAAAASGVLSAHAQPLSSVSQLPSATPAACQQVCSGALSMLCHQLSAPHGPSSIGSQLRHITFTASLNAIAANVNMLHALDVPSSDQTSIDHSLGLGTPAMAQQVSDDLLPNGSALYVIVEGIRASSLSLQPDSICRSAREFATLLPELQQLTADAQPLAYDQLLRSLEPTVAELISWHHRLQPIVQQLISRLTGPTGITCIEGQLTAALLVDLLALYIESLTGMLHSCMQLPQPQTAAIDLLSPLCNWARQLFCSLVSLARSANSQLEADLSSSEGSRQTVHELLSLCLPMDQACSALDKVDLHLGARYAAVFQKGRPRDACALLAEQTGIESQGGSDPILMRLIQPWLIDSPSASSALLFSLQMAADSSCRAACQLLSLSRSSNTMPSQEQSAWSEILEACQDLRASVRLSEDRLVSTSSTQLLQNISSMHLCTEPQAELVQQSMLAINTLALAKNVEADDLRDVLIEAAVSTSRSVLSCPPYAEDVSPLIQGLFEALTVGSSQSDKHILVGLSLLMHSGPQAKEVKPLISKAFREQPRGISWWLDKYTLEQPGEASELCTAGLDLLRNLLLSSSEGQQEFEAVAESTGNSPEITNSLQPSLSTANSEEKLLLADLIQALPCTAALQSKLEEEPDSLPESVASDGNPDLQASSSNHSSSDHGPQDIMQLLSILLASASQTGMAGLEPLLQFPALMCEHLSSGHLHCQAALHLMPVLSFVRDLLYFAAQPTPLAPAVLPAEAQEDSASQTIANGPVAAELATTDATTAQSLNAGEETEFEDAEGVGLEESEDDDGIGEEDMLDEEEIAEVLEAEEDQMQLQVIDEQAFQEVVNDLAVSDPASAAALRRAAELSATAPGTRNAVFEHAQAIADQAVGQLSEAELRPVNVGSAETGWQCSYVGSGKQYVEQHWFFCYTCNLVESKGCCSACARTCHAGHDLVYSGRSRFYCDCGAGIPGVPACKCMRPVHLPQARDSKGSSSVAEPSTFAGSPFAPRMTWDSSADAIAATNEMLQLVTGEDSQEGFSHKDALRSAASLQSLADTDPQRAATLIQGALDALAGLCRLLLDRLLGAARARGVSAAHANAAVELPAQIEIGQVDGQQPLVMQQQHVYKIPTLEPKAASRFTGSVWGVTSSSGGKKLQEASDIGVLHLRKLACSHASGLLAVAKGRHVGLLNMESMATSNAVNTNSGGNHIVNFTPTLTGRHDAMFDVAFLCFDRVSGLRLIIAGLENVQVWSLSDTGKPQDRLPVVLPMDSSNSASTLGVYGSCITQVDWLPGTMVKLAIAAQQQVFVYDLSVAADAPVVVIQLPQTQARLAAFTIFRDMLLSADSSEKRSGTACPIMLLLTDKLEVHRARLPQSCSAHSLGQAQPPATPQILAAEPLPIPAAYQAPSGSQDNSHTNAHTIMWSAATQRAVIGCNEVMGSSSKCLLRILTLSCQAEQVLQCSEARGDQNFGCLTSPLIEVPLLPLARRELATPALLAAHLSTPSAEVASPMLMAWQGAEGARSPALATQQLQMSQSTAEGLACMMLPQLQQTILVALDSRSQLHVFYTPQPAGMYHEESFVMPDVPSGGRSAEQTTPASPLSDMSPATYAAHLLGMRLPSRGSSSQRNAMARRSAVAFAMDRQSAGSPRARGLSEPGDVPASTLVYPMETFESCQTIMADTIISGDIGQAGGAAALKAALRDVAAAVEAPSLQGMKLILRSDNSSLAIIGIRILVGVTGASHTPSEALLGERRTQFSENGQRRWYLLALSPEEAVRMHPNVTLLVGAACNPAVKPRIDGLEVFALPLADVKTQVDACQSRQDAAICHLPAVATTAFCTPGHLMVAEPEALAAEHLLGQAMLMACAIETLCFPGLQNSSAGDAAQLQPAQKLQRVLIQASSQTASSKAMQASLTGTTQDIIALKPNIAVEWQPGSIVIYSAWAIQAHAFPGDAWSVALETLDKASLSMAQAAIHEGLEQGKAAAQRPVPESLGWVLLAAFNQVLHIFGQKPPAGQTLTARELCLSCNAVEGMMAQSHADHLPCAVAPGLAMALASSGLCLSDAGRASASNKDIICGLLLHPREEVRRAALQCLCAGLQQAEGRSLDDGWASPGAYVQLAGHIVTQTHGAAGWEALCSFQFLNFIAVSLPVSAESKETVVGGVLAAVSKAAIDWEDTRGQRDHIQVLRLMTMANIATHLQGNMEGTPESSESQQKRDPSLVKLAQMPGLLPFLLKILQKSVTSTRKAQGPSNGIQASALGCGELLSEPIPSCSDPRSSANKDVLQPFADQASVKAAGSRLFLDVEAAQARAVITVACAISSHAGSAMTEGSAKGAWRQVLCKALVVEELAACRKSIRRVLLHICGGHSAYRDAKATYSLQAALQESDSAANGLLTSAVPWTLRCSLRSSLMQMAEAAEGRPRSWANLCAAQPSLLAWLADGALTWGSHEISVPALQLICHAMPTPDDLKVARPDKSLGEADHSWLWPPLASSASALRDPAALQASRLAHIFAKQALGSPAAALRRAACSVVQGLWRYLVLHGRRKLSAAVALLQTLLEWLPHFAAHGKASLEAFQLVSSLLEGGDQFKPKAAPSESSEESGARKGKAGKATKAETGAAPGTPPYAGRAGMFVREALESKAIAGAFAALQHQNQVLSNHPLASAYQQLKELLDFQGFFLEDDVHYAAHEPRFEQLKLESVEAETKFTDSQIMARLQGIFAIKGFSLQIKDQTPSRMVRTLNIHMCNLPLSELSDLKGRPEVWEKALSLHVAPRQSEVKHQVSVPITASCLMIEFADFWTDLNEASTEVLQCPRCSHLVSDPHGVCRFCRENAFQCRHCRNINYEKLDGFLCNECGRSRHARFECSVTAAPLGHFPVPANDIEMSQALVGLQDAADMVHEKRTALSSLRGSVLTALGSMQASTPASSSIPGPAQSSTAGTKGVAKPVVQLGSLYLDKCKPAAEALAHSTRYLQHIQAALSTRSRRHGLANAQGSQPAALLQPGASYGSAEQFVESMMAVLGLIVQNSPGPALQAVVGSDIVTELFVCNLKKGTAQGRIAASALLVGIAHKVKSARLDLAALIRGRVMYALKQHRALDVAAATQDEISLLSKLMVPKGRHQIDQQAWEAQLQLVLHLLAQAIDVASKHPATTQHVIMPCLRILLGILKPGLQAAAPAGTPSKASVKTKPKVSNGSARNQKPTSNGSYAPGVPYGQEGTGPVVSIQEFQEGHAGLATYQDRFSDAAAAAAKMRGGKLDRSSRLATMCAHHWRAWACRRASHRSASIGPSPGTSAGLAPALGIGMLQGKKLIASLLLSPTGPGVRELAAELFQSLCRGSSHLRFNLLARFVELLPDAVVTGEHAAEYFSTLTSLLDEEAAVAYSANQGVLDILVQQASALTAVLLVVDHGAGDAAFAACSRLCQLSPELLSCLHRQIQGGSFGYTLHQLATLLEKLGKIQSTQRQLLLGLTLQRALFVVAGLSSLIIQRSKLTGDAEVMLEEFLQSSVTAGEKPARTAYAKAGLALLGGLWQSEATSGAAGQLYRLSPGLLYQICWAIKPEKQDVPYLLVLEKSGTQEEYIRGSLPHNPYFSTQVGPLMRNVKNFICEQLDLAGLIDDDFGMELLVAGSIINLSLPVKQVFELFWKQCPAGSASGAAGTAQATPNRADQEPIGPAMIVTFRLQGLDGEATEPMVNELKEQEATEAGSEEEFAVARALLDGSFLPQLLHRLQARETVGFQESAESTLLLRLLHQAVHLDECRVALLQQGGLPKLLSALNRALAPIRQAAAAKEGQAASASAASETAGVTGTLASFPLAAEDLISLLASLEQLARAQSSHPGLVRDLGAEEDARVEELAAGLKALVMLGMDAAAAILARTLPQLAQQNDAGKAALLDHFSRYLDLAGLDRAQEAPQSTSNQEQQQELQSLLQLAESLDGQAESNRAFFQLMLDRQLPQQLASYMTGLFVHQPHPDDMSKQDASQEGSTADSHESAASGATPQAIASTDPADEAPVLCEANSHQWTEANKRPGLLYALQLLRALVSQHQAGALALAGAPHLLPLLHLLEGPGNVQQIGSAAEILLEEIAEAAGSEIKDEIDSLRNATRARMRELALRNRQATLAAMGMQQVGPTARLQAAEGSQLAQAFAEMEEESGEESELVCMVCKEGYATAPRQLLGTYCFCTVAAASEHPAIAPPPSILAALPSTAAQQVHMTVSHFNLIHFDCHAAARRADSSLRVAKREWEGATLRNGGTLTNNLLPVKGKDVPGGAVAAAVATFLDNLAIVGAAQGTSASRARSRTAVIPSHVQVSLVASDIASVLERFASGSSFSEQSHGGGRESNSYLLPYLVQLGRYLASCCSASDRQGLHQEVAALGKPVNESMQSLASATAVQKLPHALALSLLLMSLDEWQAATLPSLQHTLCHALHVRQQIGKEIANGQCSTEPRGLFAKCAPLLRFFFLINQIQHALKPPGKDWATEMDTRLEALQATMETSRGFMELLSQLEEAESFQEMLDLTNLLPLVLKTHEGADALLQASAALSTDMLHPET
ncbi:hypothetical protein WJX74_000015 [Apatococcus lobatus]|uniref:UBR-type domain-containing protein n=1 Tax=Apatococcus lobatus TaxID=904363 RepID=A0AAW1RVX9_9CHLO